MSTQTIRAVRGSRVIVALLIVVLVGATVLLAIQANSVRSVSTEPHVHATTTDAQGHGFQIGLQGGRVREWKPDRETMQAIKARKGS